MQQDSLFGASSDVATSPSSIALPPGTDTSTDEGALHLWHPLFPTTEANRYFLQLKTELAWLQDDIVIAGKAIPIPRLQAWYGDKDSAYTYSGLSLAPLPWHPALLQIKSKIETLTGHHFNSVLANLYRDGNDSVGWHQDNEKELGTNPVIASISFGSVRQFRLRHKKEKDRSISLDLPHNSLLLMSGSLQHHWRHCIPKTKKPCGERINLTFRQIKMKKH